MEVYQRGVERSHRLWSKDRLILPMDHMTQVGPVPLPLLDELYLESNAVLCTLLR